MKGLVWNAGERVEGYTNFGWTAILALCHLLGFSPAYTCLLVQILGIPTLCGCLVGGGIIGACLSPFTGFGDLRADPDGNLL